MARKRAPRHRPTRPLDATSPPGPARSFRRISLLLLLAVTASAGILGFIRWWGPSSTKQTSRPRIESARLPLGEPPVDAAKVLGIPPEVPHTITECQQELRSIRKELLENLADHPEAQTQVALIDLDLGREDDALRQWRRILDLDDTFATAHLGIGTILADRGENAQAVEPLRKALELDPKLEPAYRQLTEILLREGEAAEALKVARQAVDRFPGSCENHFWLGQCYLQLGDYEKARRSHEQAIALDPSWSLSYYPLATACARLGDREQATRYRERFAELKRNDLEADRQETRTYDDLATQTQELVKRHVVAGSLHLRFGELSRAEAHWLRASSLDPEDRATRRMLASLYEQQQRVGAELTVLKDLIRLEPEEPAYLLRKGQLLSDRAQWDEAERVLQDALRRWPSSGRAHMLLAQLYLRSAKNLDTAVMHAERAANLERSPTNFKVLAAVRAERGDLPGARAALKEALAMDPNNREVRDALEQLGDSR